MKIVLLTLSGNADKATEALAAEFKDSRITNFLRTSLEKGGALDRLRALRNEKPDVFVVVTESLDWQYGQEALMLFGALAGAGRSMIMDSRGGIRSARRTALLLLAPFRIARSMFKGRLAVRRARRTLDRLEKMIQSPDAQIKTGSGPTGNVAVAYLRATPAPGTQPGGATSHINGVVNGLVGLGATISFISNDEIAGLNKHQVKFQTVRPDPDVMPRAAFDVYNGMTFASAAAELVAGSPPDLIYQRYCRFSWAGVKASLAANVPLFLEYNGSEVWIGRNWDRTEQLDLLERCERLNLDGATRIFVISDVERDNLLRIGIPAEKIVVNPNGVDTDVFRPHIGGLAERENLGIPPAAILVGFVGTFGPWHGVLALADAIALVPRSLPIHFLLIGEGSLRSEVEQKLTLSGDLDRVTLTGLVSHDRVPIMLDMCDILVSPHVPLADGSEFFGSPTKLFEYMAMGKAILASRLGQIGDVLVDNETALLVEPGDPRELCAGIERLANDTELRRRLGEGALAVAVERHTWRRNAERILSSLG
jgi:glycosyltransferase involved in cell wall biosynthesis